MKDVAPHRLLDDSAQAVPRPLAVPWRPRAYHPLRWEPVQLPSRALGLLGAALLFPATGVPAGPEPPLPRGRWHRGRRGAPSSCGASFRCFGSRRRFGRCLSAERRRPSPQRVSCTSPAGRRAGTVPLPVTAAPGRGGARAWPRAGPVHPVGPLPAARLRLVRTGRAPRPGALAAAGPRGAPRLPGPRPVRQRRSGAAGGRRRLAPRPCGRRRRAVGAVGGVRCAWCRGPCCCAGWRAARAGSLWRCAA